jgi:hypothetical protein
MLLCSNPSPVDASAGVLLLSLHDSERDPLDIAKDSEIKKGGHITDASLCCRLRFGNHHVLFCMAEHVCRLIGKAVSS